MSATVRTWKRPARGAPIEDTSIRETLLLAGIALLFALSVLGPVFTAPPGGVHMSSSGGGSTLRQINYLVVVGMILFALRPMADFRRLLTLTAPLTLALAWCWLSLSWSLAPGIAVRRLALTTMLIWAVFAGVRHIGAEKSLTVMRGTLVLCLVANYVAVAGWPQIGIHTLAEAADPNIPGMWRGVMMHKNFAGASCALTILTFLFDNRKERIWQRVLVIAASAFFLYKTGSKTSAGILGFSILTGLLYLRYNPKYRALCIPVGIILVTGAIYWSLTNADVFTAPFNTKTAFTGRVQIWPALYAYASDHLWFGAGFGSFWDIGPASPIYRYARDWVIDLSNGHNGYLDLFTTLGLPGLILVVVATMIWPLVRLFASFSIPPALGALLISVLIFCMGHNLTETSVFDRDVFLQIILMWTVAMVTVLDAPSWPKERLSREKPGG